MAEAVLDNTHINIWMKPYRATQNVCESWLSLRTHDYGSSEKEAIEEAAERRLDSLVYHGENLVMGMKCTAPSMASVIRPFWCNWCGISS
jgi:hypothetical protein